MPRVLRWGVLGVSAAVGRQAILPALLAGSRAEIIAIGSRDPQRAVAEAARFGARRAYGSYEAVLRDPEVEAIYIPLPNGLHAEWTRKAAAAGKQVLCEKPLACNVEEAQEMAATCARCGVWLMEAYMTPFHPRTAAAIRLAAGGALGVVHSIQAVFTFPLQDPENHRWRPELGGGSLLDLGIYCVAPMLALAGREPVEVAGRIDRADSGVDASCSGQLDFGGGLVGRFDVSFVRAEQQTLEIGGSEATLRMERSFTPGPHDTAMESVTPDGRRSTLHIAGNDPYQALVEHFTAMVFAEERSRRTPAESIATLRVLDRLRATAETEGAPFKQNRANRGTDEAL